MSAPATVYQVESALIRFVRLVLPALICGLVAVALLATNAGPQRAAADTLDAAGADTSSSEQPASPRPVTAPAHAIGNDARQETALTVLLLLAVANARADRKPAAHSRTQAGEASLPGRLGSTQTLETGRVQ